MAKKPRISTGNGGLKMPQMQAIRRVFNRLDSSQKTPEICYFVPVLRQIQWGSR
jgi:hypothetical protein